MTEVELRPSGRTLAAVGIVAGATLAFQIALSRLFAAAVAYHFGFLAISLALLGTGGGALYVYARRVRSGGGSSPSCSRWCAAAALLFAGCVLLLVRLDFAAEGVGFYLRLAVACVAAALPLFACGVVLAVAITGYIGFVGRVYASDLIGASLGAGLVVPALAIASPPVLIAALGAVLAGAGILFAGPRGREARLNSGIAAGACGLVAAATITPILELPLQLPPGLSVDRVAQHWTPLARIVGVGAEKARVGLLFYDRVYAPIPGIGKGVEARWDTLVAGPPSIGYQLTGPGRTLIIGGGGGRDIHVALSEGQNPVDVIELIDGNRRVVDEDFGDLSGRPYSRDGVTTAIGDGRSVLASRSTLYDQIHIGFTDTLSANSAQGFALMENSLYTLEAFVLYLEHLKPRGILNVSRLLNLVGEEALRATVLTLAALRESGIEHPERHVVVVLGKDLFGALYGTVLARLEPYSPDELARIARLAEERGEGLAMAPEGPYYGPWKDLAAAPSLEAFCAAYPMDVCPPTDDRPFFFSMQRIGGIGGGSTSELYTSGDPFTILLVTLVVLLALSTLAFLGPMAFLAPPRPDAISMTYFAAIGLGFLLLEVVLIQRFVFFLGYPTYALSVVLFTLLLASGIGASLSGRMGRRGLVACLSLVVALAMAGAWGLQPLLGAWVSQPFPLRLALTVALLTPLGLCLGVAMPIGLRRLQGTQPSAVPYAWGVNGIFSVVSSVLAVALAIQWGFAVTTVVAAACYGVALAHAASSRWPRTLP